LFRARGIALGGALILVAGAAGVAAYASAASPSHAVSVTLSYTCRFPSGTQQVSVVVAATFPSSATVGQQIQPDGLRLTAQLPAAAVADLRKLGAATVTGADTLAVTVASAGAPAQAQWPGGAATRYPVPKAGSLRLAAPGTAAPLQAGGPGQVTFIAGVLTLTLAGFTAGGTPASPAKVQVSCGIAAGQDASLAAVQVAAASPSASPSSAPPHRAPAKKKHIKFPPGCGKIKTVGTGVATCGYITGYSDVRKLYGAALLQPKKPAKPGLVNVDFAERHKFVKGKLVVFSTGELYYLGKHQLPPITATFLAFRFVPVTATLQLTELTPIKIVSVSGVTAPPFPITVHATTTLSVHVSDVKVNGVPLPVGAQCGTAKPVTLTLIGRGDNTIPPKGYTVSTGGPLSGTLAIPRFVKCGVSENLDPLLTGSISGPGNFAKITQGKLCGPSQPADWACPPPVPKPKR
jgi:hypothetical protein